MDASHACTHKRVSITQAETRAEFAERTVAKLEKTIDDLEGMTFFLVNLLDMLLLFIAPVIGCSILLCVHLSLEV